MEEKKGRVVKPAFDEEPGMNKYGVQPSEMPKVGEYKGGIVKSEKKNISQKTGNPEKGTAGDQE